MADKDLQAATRRKEPNLKAAGAEDRNPQSPLRRNLLWAGTLLSLGLGYVGFMEHARHLEETTTPLECLYRSMQLFVLHMGHVELPLNPWLEIARFLAPFVTGFATTEGLLRLARDKVRKESVHRYRDHVLVCGTGLKGLHLAREFHRRGEKVVVLDRDPNSPGFRECEKLGIPGFAGDASDRKVLESYNTQKASVILATCGEDGANIQIAVAARQLASTLRDGARSPLRCFVDISNVDLRTMFRQKKMLAGDDRRFTVTVTGIDLYENSARWLLRNNPLHRGPNDRNSPFRVHLVIVGFGQMGESIFLHAARTAHYPNGKRLKVTVIDPEAVTKERQFRGRYPEIDRICDVAFLPLAPDDPALVALAVDYCREDEFLPTFVVCFPDDTRNLAVALKLKPEISDFKCPIRVRVTSRDGMGGMLTEGAEREQPGHPITSFGILDDVCNLEMLERLEQDKLARAIHEDYVAGETRKGNTPETNPSMLPWDELDESLRDSNRYAADHIEVKLWAIGCRRSRFSLGAEPIPELTKEQVDILAPMEHFRYCAERFLAGWKPGGTKDNAARTNPTLVPWDDLPDSEKEKDHSAVMNLPHLIDLVDEKIYPA